MTMYNEDVQTFLLEHQGLNANLIFADPPYNLEAPSTVLGKGIRDKERDDIEWDIYDDREAFLDFTSQWLESARGVLAPNGAIAVMGNFAHGHDAGHLMLELGYYFLGTIVWDRNAPPNFANVRPRNNMEMIMWAKLDKKSKYKFRPEPMKKYNNGKQIDSIWRIPNAAGGERLGVQIGRKKKSAHPTQKPIELVRRFIEMTTDEGDLVLDIFGGTGTTSVAAHRMGRKFIYVEKELKYFELAKQRLIDEGAYANT